jgi:hypothetical protein
MPRGIVWFDRDVVGRGCWHVRGDDNKGQSHRHTSAFGNKSFCLYHHVLLFERFWGLSVHLLSRSMGSVDAWQKKAGASMAILKPAQRI